MVATSIASRMGSSSNCTQQVSPNCARDSHVGPTMGWQEVQAHCGNMAVVYAVNKRSASNPALVRLLSILSLQSAIYDVTLVACHLLGIHNTAADALPRNNLVLFRSVLPLASPMPTIIPIPLQEMLLNPSLSALSHCWTQRLSTTLQMVSRCPHIHCTPLPSGDTYNFVNSSG